MIKLIDLLKNITLLEYNKSQLNYISSKLDIQDALEFEKIMNALNIQGIKYLDLKKQIEDKEIKNIDDLKKLKTISKSDIKKQGKSDIIKLLDNDNFLIVQPKTYEAGCYYGAGTKWCITAKGEEGEEKFKEYSEDAPLTLILDKSKSPADPLYKIAIYTYIYFNSYDIVIYDSKDKRINTEDYLKYLTSKGIDINKILKSYKKNIK